MTVVRWLVLGSFLVTGIAACAQSGNTNDDDGSGSAASGSTTGGGGSQACDGGTERCGEECVNLQSSHAHCGGCNQPCSPTQACTLGVCTPCQSAELVGCDDGCVNLSNNAFNCGSCNNACPAGQACDNFLCSCGSGLFRCGDACVNTLTDNANCGSCGNACPSGQMCSAGQCRPDCGSLTDCNGECVDLSTDPDHCTACNNVCGAGLECTSTGCTCNDPGLCGACGLIDLGTSLPDESGNTTGNLDSLTPSCGGSGGPDAPFLFTAPEAGFYVFDTSGSGFDTVLSLKDAGCAQIDCDDDGGVGSQSKLVVSLEEDEQVMIVVEGWGGATGNFVLQGDLAVCIAGPLGTTLPTTVNGSTAGRPNAFDASCNFGDGPEYVYSYTVPTSGAYRFDLAGSDFEAVIDIKRDDCTGATIACANDGADSVVGAYLDAGQQIAVLIEGYDDEGDFTLNVSAGACPATNLGSTAPQTASGTTVGSINSATPVSCGGGSGPDVALSFTATVAGTYKFDTFGSPFDTVLYARTSCGGTELACDDDTGVGTQSEISVALAANQTIVLIVDGFSSTSTGAFTLHVTPP